MKILVLTPCNITNLDFCIEIWKRLNPSVQSCSFCVPMFMQYLVDSRQAADQTEAFFFAMRAAEKVYSGKKDNVIIFGNMTQEYSFDAVFNIQSGLNAPYRDLFIEALNQVIQPDGEDDSAYLVLSRYTTNLHKSDESRFPLENADATADFLNSYISTNVESKLEELKQEYFDTIDKINEEGKASKEAIKVLNNDRDK